MIAQGTDEEEELIMSMSLENAIRTAIEFENRVHQTYVKAEARASDAAGKKVFGTLAREELGHISYLESRLAEWQKTGHVAPTTLSTAVPAVQRIREGTAKLRSAVKGKGTHDYSVELELLQQALRAEQETSGFYQRMVAELDAEGQALFARFLEIEQGHVAIVQAEIDSVQGLGFWFDMQEFRLEAE